jgi:hypothetical protein
MALIEVLRERLGDEKARSFQLMGEDLVLLSGAEIAAAAEAWRAELVRTVPPELCDRFKKEQEGLLVEAHRMLGRYNRSLRGRIAGYLSLGRRCDFRYPWPVVAVLGLCQVISGLGRSRVYGLVGPVAKRFGWEGLEGLADGLDDLLRRTNRGIFADSVPTVLLGLRCAELRRSGEGAVAEALLDGPPPVVLDRGAMAIARGLAEGLGIEDEGERFRALAALTQRHFEREQAIFTHHMGPGREERRAPAWIERLIAVRSIPAPVVERSGGARRLVFRPFPLPEGFEMRDHPRRVEAFGRAFVSSVTGEVEDYRAAMEWVLGRFGRK